MTAAPAGAQEVEFQGEGIKLHGWKARSSAGQRRGTVIYLHGVADHRGSGAGVIERFCPRGFDVIAYDSRAHGHSGGEACTYGYFEKADLQRVLDTLEAGPVVLIGSSLGGAVALQQAAVDPRISTVVSAEAFSDLKTVVTERAPFVFTPVAIEQSIQIAEEKGHFEIEKVSPVLAARHIKVPVLIIHGEADTETPPQHANRIFNALAGPKRLILVPKAKHNGSLSGNDIWQEIERWIDSIVPVPVSSGK